jgi:hypothetical protein
VVDAVNSAPSPGDRHSGADDLLLRSRTAVTDPVSRASAL